MSATLSVPAAPVPAPTPAQPAANGRFQKGNRGGPGNPFGRQLAAFRAAVFAAATPERVQRIADAILTKAEEGDVAAARLILPYLLGRPSAGPDPDRIDLELWKLARDEAAAREAEQPANGVPAGQPAPARMEAARPQPAPAAGPKAPKPAAAVVPLPVPLADRVLPLSLLNEASAAPAKGGRWPEWALDLIHGPEGDSWRATLEREYGPAPSPNGV